MMFWRGVLGYLPANVVQGITGLLAIVAFTRLLSPDAYGVYALAFSVMSLVHTCLFVWLEASMARFYAPEADADRLPAHFATLYRAEAVLGVAAVLIGAAVLWILPLAHDMEIAIGAGLVAIPARSLAKMVQERRRAAGEVGPSAVLDIAQSSGAFLFGLALAWMGMGGAAPLAGTAIASGLCVAWTLPKELKSVPPGPFERERARMYAVYGLPVALSLVLALALSTTDRFLIDAFLDEASVGVYHAGYSLSNRSLDVMFIWLGMAGGPAAIAALERGGRPALEAQARDQASMMLLICAPAAVGLALVARPLADLMVGPELRDGAAQVTPWIAVSGFCSGLTTYYFHQAFTLARRTGLLLAAMTVPAAANIGLCLVLIPRFGMDGAMWATAASYGLGLLASLLIGRTVMPLPIPWGTVWRCTLACAVMALAVLAVPAWGGALELLAKAGAGAVVYGLVAVAVNAGGARQQSGRLIRLVQARSPA
jgi:O-antigen/teichoic acid export membrane protein